MVITDGSSLNNTETNVTFGLNSARSQEAIITYGIFLSAILLLSLFGNFFVVACIVRIKQLHRDNSNIFLVNLSITDMSNAILVMLSSLIALCDDDWRMPAFWCQLQCAFNYCFIIVSMLTLALISIDRYHTVENALEYPNIITKKRIYLMIIYAWIQGLAFAVAPVILGWIQYDYQEIVCAIDWFKEPNTLYYVIIANIVCFIAPGIILFYCYASIAKTAKRLAQRLTISSTVRINSPRQDTNMSRTIKSLIIVVAIFFFCMTPFCITKLLKVVTGNPQFVPGFINTISTLLQYTASATNPFIYGIFRRDFRVGFKRQLQKLFFFAPCFSEMTSSAFSSSHASLNTQVRKRSTDITQLQEYKVSNTHLDTGMYNTAQAHV